MHYAEPSLGVPGHVVETLQAENGEKQHTFESIYLSN